VVAHAVVDLFIIGDVAETPVGIEGVRGELLETGSGLRRDGVVAGEAFAAPPGEGGIDGAGEVERAVGITAEGVAVLVLVPELGLDGFGDGVGAGAGGL